MKKRQRNLETKREKPRETERKKEREACIRAAIILFVNVPRRHGQVFTATAQVAITLLCTVLRPAGTAGASSTKASDSESPLVSLA